MTDRVFFDTNILVYANDSEEPRKQSIARNLIKNALAEETSVISVQVLAANSAHCKIVYSEDMQDGQIISNMRILNPFTL